MKIAKLNPWNWFTKEEEQEQSLPVQRRRERRGRHMSPLQQMHEEMDRIFENFFRSPFFEGGPLERFVGKGDVGMSIRPRLDVGGTEKEYHVSLELPGVDEKDVHIELADGVLTIRGEKKQESEEKERGYYRMERSYGSFERVLSVPADVDVEGITATHKDGVLTLTLPRKAMEAAKSKTIGITAG